MPITQYGALNTTALVVPDLYVQIVPPSAVNLNGVPTNVVGVVGTSSWGPKNTPTVFGSMSEYASVFGPIIARQYDMGTPAALAVQQGAQAFVGVRVTDGTDVAASVSDNTTTPDITFTARYTGSLGNSITVTLSAGANANTWNAMVSLPGVGSEIFQNIGGTGNAFWVNLANAINNGQLAAFQGPSQIITAAAGSGTAAPTAASYTLTGGTDGASTVTTTTLVGSDTVSPQTGMYALRNQNASIGILADATESTEWGPVAQFGLAEGIYFVNALPAGNTVAESVTAVQAAGVSNYSMKIMHGDWIWWQDTTNAVLRLVSPQGFAAGVLANQSPNQSSLNKQLFGVVGSQRSGVAGTSQLLGYSSADLQALFSAGIDVISFPAPGGNYWTVRAGINASSGQAKGTGGDNYTRMTNYLAATLNAGMGQFVGDPITTDLLSEIAGAITSFLQNLVSQGFLSPIVSSSNTSPPYSVVCDASNNPQSAISRGYVTCNAQVTYESINRFFIVNMQGGQTVSVSVN